ncbi:MAG: hypothetical protein ACREN1_05200 [Candidatus Dormibacteria bacterium]
MSQVEHSCLGTTLRRSSSALLPEPVAAEIAAHGKGQIRFRLGDLPEAVQITGRAYRDPKDALNELGCNAAIADR